MSVMQKVLGALVERRDLSREDMQSAVGAIMDGDATAAQAGAFLAALRMKGETVAELVAAVRAMRERSLKVCAGDGLVDTCGTGGDGLGTFNISTASSFVVAAGGLRVAKHGNRAASGKVGAADVLEAAGANLEMPPDAVVQCLDSSGIAFLFAPVFHPAVRNVALARREVGFRTLFNLTGPLCNPAGADRQVLGVFGTEWMAPVAEALAELGSRHALVVHGSDGSDEITLTGTSSVLEVRKGEPPRPWGIDPGEFGLSVCRAEDLDGGADATEAAEILRGVLTGRDTGPRRDIVALNAGAALYVGGAVSDMGEGVVRCLELLDSGEPERVLSRFVDATRRLTANGNNS